MQSVLEELQAILRRVSAMPPPDSAALRAYLAAVESAAWKITDEQVALLRERYSDDELFERTVAAAVAAGIRRLESGLRALT